MSDNPCVTCTETSKSYEATVRWYALREAKHQNCNYLSVACLFIFGATTKREEWTWSHTYKAQLQLVCIVYTAYPSLREPYRQHIHEWNVYRYSCVYECNSIEWWFWVTHTVPFSVRRYIAEVIHDSNQIVVVFAIWYIAKSRTIALSVVKHRVIAVNLIELPVKGRYSTYSQCESEPQNAKFFFHHANILECRQIQIRRTSWAIAVLNKSFAGKCNWSTSNQIIHMIYRV